MMAVQHHQQSSSGPLSLISCVSARESSPVDDVHETKNDGKKKRFHPFRNLRRMFRRKNRQLEVADVGDSEALDGDVRGLDPRRSSAGRLTDDEAVGSRRRSTSLVPGLSLSHDSVFKPERTDSGNSSSDLDNSSLSIPILIPKPRFAAELADAMRRRAREDSDDDLGLPRSRCSSATDYPDKYGDRVGKSQSSCSEGSLLSTGSSFEDDLEAVGQGSDLDLKVTRHKLSHSAAKHKMAIRPRRNHAPATKRLMPVKLGSPLPVTPEVNEEASSWTGSVSSPQALTPAAASTPPVDFTPEVREKLTLPAKPERISHGKSEPMDTDLPKQISLNNEPIAPPLKTPVMFGTKTPLASLGACSLRTPNPSLTEPKSMLSTSNKKPEMWSKSASLPHGAALSTEAKVARSLSSAASARVEIVSQTLKPGSSKESELQYKVDDTVDVGVTVKITDTKTLMRIPNKTEIDGARVTKSLSRTADKRQRMDPIDIPAHSPPAPTWPASMAAAPEPVAPIPVASTPAVVVATTPASNTTAAISLATSLSISPPKAIWPEKSQTERTGIFIKNERTRRDSRESKPPIKKSHSFHKDSPDDDSSKRLYLKNRRGSRKEDNIRLSKKSTSLESIGYSDTMSLPATLNSKTVRSASSDSVRSVIVTHDDSHEEPRYANYRNLLLGHKFDKVHHGYENIEIIELVKKERDTLEKVAVNRTKSKILEPVGADVVNNLSTEMPEFMKVQLRESRSSTLVELRKSEQPRSEIEEPKSIAKPFKKQTSLIEFSPKQEAKIKKQASFPETADNKKQISLIEIGLSNKEEVQAKKQANPSNIAVDKIIPGALKDEVKLRREIPIQNEQLAENEKPRIKPGDNVVIVEKSGDVTLRKKSPSSASEESELMKVFARRSLKVKDEPEDCPRSRDSDKENDVDERKEDNRPLVPLKPATPLKPVIAARNSLLKYSKPDKSKLEDNKTTELKNKLNEKPKNIFEKTTVTIIETIPKKPEVIAEKALKGPEVLKIPHKSEIVIETIPKRPEVITVEKPKRPEIIQKTQKPLDAETIPKKPAVRIANVVIKDSCDKKIDHETKQEKEGFIENISVPPIDMTEADENKQEAPGFKTIQDRKAEWEKRFSATKNNY